MISLNAKKDKDTNVIYTTATSKCDEKGCNATCNIKLRLSLTEAGLYQEVMEHPPGWVVSFTHTTCDKCFAKLSPVLIFDDPSITNAHREKLARLAMLRDRITKLRAIK